MAQALKIASVIFVFGFFVSLAAAVVLTQGETMDLVFIGILYLAAVVAGCTYLIIQAVKDRGYGREEL